MSLRLHIILVIILLGAGLPATVVTAEEKSLKPIVAKGKGEQCVAETDFMRRNHMDLLTHDRDLTMYQGLREIDFSLKGCIDCHAVADDKGKAVTVKDERHFCRSCHDFAAVTIDCFQCHASRPGEEKLTGLDKSKMPLDKVHNNALAKANKEETKP